MSREREELLYNVQSLTDVLSHIKEQIASDVKEHGAYRTLGERPPVPREELIEKYRLRIAKITGKEVRVLDDTVECIVKYAGANGSFFNYIPSKKVEVDRPSGWVISDCVILYFNKTSDTATLKTQINEVYEDLTVWHQAVTEDVLAINSQIPGLVDEAIAAHEDKKSQDKALEDELNS